MKSTWKSGWCIKRIIQASATIITNLNITTITTVPKGQSVGNATGPAMLSTGAHWC